MRLLLIRLSSLGDVILCTPVVKALRRSFPSASISMVVNTKFADLFKWDPDLNEVIPLKPASLRQIVGRADVAIDLHNRLKTAFIALLSGARKRIGYEGQLSPLYTDPVSDEGGHIVERHVSLLRPLGIDPKPIPPVEVCVPERFKRWAWGELGKRGVPGEGIRIGLFPGAGWPSKMWGEGRFAEVGRRAVDQLGAHILVFGGPSERGLAERVASLIGRRAHPFEGLNLIELAALISTCHLFVSNDTGPMHLAAAVGVPTLGLFGPGDPARFSPWAPGCHAIKGDAPCSPCRLFKSCDGRRCMGSISVEEVWRWVEGRCEEVLRGS